MSCYETDISHLRAIPLLSSVANASSCYRTWYHKRMKTDTNSSKLKHHKIEDNERMHSEEWTIAQ